MDLFKYFPGLFLRGKHKRNNEPMFTLKAISAACGIPLYSDAAAHVASAILNWGPVHGYRQNGQSCFLRHQAVTNHHSIINKARAAKILSDNGLSPSFIRAHTITDRPALVKPINSYGGHGIRLRKNGMEMIDPSKYFLQEYIEKEKEYRVFFLSYDHNASFLVPLVMEKIPKPDSKEVVWCRNNCYTWRTVPYSVRISDNSDHCNSLIYKTIKAASLLAIEWGAADVAYANNRFYVLEVNTRPSGGGGSTSPKFKRNKFDVYEQVDDIPMPSSIQAWAKAIPIWACLTIDGRRPNNEQVPTYQLGNFL